MTGARPSSGALGPGALGPGALGPRHLDADLARAGSETFDVVVVGGGIVGAGVALDAASRGLSVAVVEAQDWAAGTSSRSSKLIHGGLRYLQRYDLALVREALRERAVLCGVAPHLVRPLPILYPLQRPVLERAYVGAGVALYDVLARTSRRGREGAQRFPAHRHLTRAATLAHAPALDPDRVVGAIRFHDAQVDDARYALTVLRTAVAHGAVALSRTHVTGLLQAGGRVAGVRVRQVERGETLEIRARCVVGATGVWADRFTRLLGGEAGVPLRPSKGVHLVVPRDRLSSDSALILPTARSVLFVLPWGAHWIIGTTDTPWSHDLARPAATAADVEYLLANLNGVLHDEVRREDVEAVYVGLRPLIAASDAETTALSREHAVARLAPGLVVVSGGKYTTYRVMAEDAVDAAVEQAGLAPAPSRTAEVPLLGAGTAPGASDPRLANLAPAERERLLGRYGTLLPEVLAPLEADRSLAGAIDGYLGAEFRYAVTHEDARHLDDVLVRRTRLAMETADRGHGAAEAVACLVAPLLGWDAATTDAEVRAYRARIVAERDAEVQEDDAGAAAALVAAEPLLPVP